MLPRNWLNPSLKRPKKRPRPLKKRQAFRQRTSSIKARLSLTKRQRNGGRNLLALKKGFCPRKRTWIGRLKPLTEGTVTLAEGRRIQYNRNRRNRIWQRSSPLLWKK